MTKRWFSVDRRMWLASMHAYAIACKGLELWQLLACRRDSGTSPPQMWRANCAPRRQRCGIETLSLKSLKKIEVPDS